MSWQIERVASPEDIGPLIPEREELKRRHGTCCGGSHYHKRGLLAADEFFIHVTRYRSARLIAAVLLLIRRSPGVGPLALRSVEFYGARLYRHRDPRRGQRAR